MMEDNKYLKMPWSIEDTIENMKILKKAFQEKVIEINLDGVGEQDAKEVEFDFDRAIKALENQESYKWNYKPEDGWTEETLPKERGQEGKTPKSYEFVIIASDIKVHGVGWLNDVWKEKTGFILPHTQSLVGKCVYIPDKPVAFSYEQIHAWREIEPFESGVKECNFSNPDGDWCPFHGEVSYSELGSHKPDDCPLKPMPEKMEVCGKYHQPGKPVPSYRIGWNDCINEICGEESRGDDY